MTKHFVFVLLLTLTVSVPGAQQQEPDQHEGQPAYCVNHGGFADFPMEEPHICACRPRCQEGQPEDTGCLTYCQRPRCKCIHECERDPPPVP